MPVAAMAPRLLPGSAGTWFLDPALAGLVLLDLGGRLTPTSNLFCKKRIYPLINSKDMVEFL
jgi:hypothetical protein